MKASRSFKSRLAKVSRLWDKQDHDAALTEVETMLGTWPGNAHLHVLKASLVQLQEETQYALNDAKISLKQAVELDPNSPEATIELGYYLDNVEDDPRTAEKAYAAGAAIARRFLIDGLIGQAKVYRQLNKQEEFLHCLQQLVYISYFEFISKHNESTGLTANIIKSQLLEKLLLVLMNSSNLKNSIESPYADQLLNMLEELGK